jgi:hypothetical protein
MTERGTHATKQPAVALLSSIALSLFVLIPWQCFQAHAFIEPYATAAQAIEHSNADVVIVDPTDVWFGHDLVRNDPFLRAPPKVLVLNYLDEAQLKDICRRYDVAIFDRRDAQRFGVRIVPSASDIAGHNGRLRDFLDSLGCGRSVLGNHS